MRGNLAAIIKAILLDPEARDCDWMMDEHNGQLREPFLRYSHFAAAMDVEQYYGRYWNIGYDFFNNTGQLPLLAPSVFNFFSPFYRPKENWIKWFGRTRISNSQFKNEHRLFKSSE